MLVVKTDLFSSNVNILKSPNPKSDFQKLSTTSVVLAASKPLNKAIFAKDAPNVYFGSSYTVDMINYFGKSFKINSHLAKTSK